MKRLLTGLAAVALTLSLASGISLAGGKPQNSQPPKGGSSQGFPQMKGGKIQNFQPPKGGKIQNLPQNNSGKFQNYKQLKGVKFQFGTYYPGKFHPHWSNRCWIADFGCFIYLCPSTQCYYWWCEEDNCWYPVGYRLILS